MQMDFSGPLVTEALCVSLERKVHEALVTVVTVKPKLTLSTIQL